MVYDWQQGLRQLGGPSQTERVLAATLHKLPVACSLILTHRTLRSAMSKKWTSPQVVAPGVHTAAIPQRNWTRENHEHRKSKQNQTGSSCCPTSLEIWVLLPQDPGSAKGLDIRQKVQQTTGKAGLRPGEDRSGCRTQSPRDKAQAHPLREEAQTPQKKILKTPSTEQSAGEAATGNTKSYQPLRRVLVFGHVVTQPCPLPSDTSHWFSHDVDRNPNIQTFLDCSKDQHQSRLAYFEFAAPGSQVKGRLQMNSTTLK